MLFKALMPIAALLFAPQPTLHAQSTPPHPRDANIAQVVRYGGTDAAPLTMDVYKLHGPAPHPAVIIIHGGGFIGGTSRNGSEAYAADFLAPAGYAVFAINYRLAPLATFAEMTADVERSVRFVRHNAAQFAVDPNKIALLGGSAGGYLSNMAGLATFSADTNAGDAVDRESDAVQAVVTLFGISELATMPNPDFVTKYKLLGDQAATPESVAAASPISHVHAGAPPFLFIQGDHDRDVPFQQSIDLMDALAAAGNRAEIIVIPNGPHATGSWHRLPGVPDWERETAEWLNRTLNHNGPVGEGIAARTSASSR